MHEKKIEDHLKIKMTAPESLDNENDKLEKLEKGNVQ